MSRVQTICKGYQQTTKVSSSGGKVNNIHTYISVTNVLTAKLTSPCVVANGECRYLSFYGQFFSISINEPAHEKGTVWFSGFPLIS